MRTNLKFLIIDDEQDIIDVLHIYILKYYDEAEVRSTDNPLEAIDYIKHGFSPNIILLDLNMPQLHGLEVVKKLLEIDPLLNIIIYTGMIEQLEFVSNIQLGIKGVLEKPSGPEELRDEFERVLSEESEKSKYRHYDLEAAKLIKNWPSNVYILIGKSKYVKLFNKGDEVDQKKILKMLALPGVNYYISVDEQNSDSTFRYSPIDIASLKATQHSPCDIYSRNTGDYKKIITKGSAIIREYLDILLKKNINQLYVEEQFEKYFAIIPENILILRINNAELTRKERVESLLHFAEEKMQAIYKEPNESNVLKIEYLAEQIAKYLNDDKAAILDIINIKTKQDAKVHAINVATLSISILQFFEGLIFEESADKKNITFAKKLSFLPAMKKNIVLAGLLHDLETSFQDNSGQSIHLHTEGTSKTIELLSQIRAIPPIVLDMIEQHKERCDGSGPKKLYKAQLNIYALILMVTDQYQLYVSEGKTPQEAIAAMYLEKNKYNEAVLHALKSVIIL